MYVLKNAFTKLELVVVCQLYLQFLHVLLSPQGLSNEVSQHFEVMTTLPPGEGLGHPSSNVLFKRDCLGTYIRGHAESFS